MRLRSPEATAIVRAIALEVIRGVLPGVPSAHVIRLAASGEISVEGPVPAGGRSVARAAQLLEALLPPLDAPAELRVPGALRLVIARAQGVLDLPPYPSLESLVTALERFAAPDATAVVRALVANWSAALAPTPASPAQADAADSSKVTVLEPFAPGPQPPVRNAPVDELTVSDLRRARRATGLTLGQIGERSRIPADLLRELEWGYLRNWPAGHYGRTQLVRYARAAGLDEELVVRTVWPLLEAAALSRGAVMPEAPVPALESISSIEHAAAPAPDPQPAFDIDLELGPPAVPAAVATRPSRRSRILAALAIPALLALAVLPAAWQRGMLRLPFQIPAVAPPPAARSTAPPIAASTDAATAAAPNAAPATVPDAVPVDAPAEDPAPPVPIPVSANASAASTELTVDGAAAEGRDAEPASDSPRRADGLTPAGVAYSPAFASVGSAMFYHSGSGGPSALLRADTDSSGAILRITRIVDDSSSNFHARPSPDGTRIAFDSDRDGERGVYVADADGRNVKRVSGEGFAAVPSWSPDGRSLAYVRAEPDRPRVWNLWAIDLESGESRRLTRHRYGQPWGGSWFADGKRIAYSHEDRLIVLDLERGTQRVYPSPRKGQLVRTPAVSPDGGRVIFQVYRDGAWLLDLTDGSMRKVLADSTAEEYTWSPDGQRVAYHSRRSGSWGVWVMAPR